MTSETVERVHTVACRYPRTGRTSVVITCPFCGTPVVAYVWSLAGSGKRCHCGAKHGPRTSVKRREPVGA